MKSLAIFVFTFFIIQQSSYCDDEATEISFGRCVEEDFDAARNCSIDKVAIRGCRKDRSGTTCNVKRNRNASIAIDFTPDFDGDGDDLEFMAYALLPGTGVRGKAFPDMDPKACKFMTCPVVKDTKNQYTFGLKLPATYPIGSFNVRFLMKYASEPKCCFFTKIRVEK